MKNLMTFESFIQQESVANTGLITEAKLSPIEDSEELRRFVNGNMFREKIKDDEFVVFIETFNGMVKRNAVKKIATAMDESDWSKYNRIFDRDRDFYKLHKGDFDDLYGTLEEKERKFFEFCHWVFIWMINKGRLSVDEYWRRDSQGNWTKTILIEEEKEKIRNIPVSEIRKFSLLKLQNPSEDLVEYINKVNRDYLSDNNHVVGREKIKNSLEWVRNWCVKKGYSFLDLYLLWSSKKGFFMDVDISNAGTLSISSTLNGLFTYIAFKGKFPKVRLGWL